MKILDVIADLQAIVAAVKIRDFGAALQALGRLLLDVGIVTPTPAPTMMANSNMVKMTSIFSGLQTAGTSKEVSADEFATALEGVIAQMEAVKNDSAAFGGWISTLIPWLMKILALLF